MNAFRHNHLRLKRTPVLTHGSNALAGGVRVAARRTLNSGCTGSSPVASTMNYATASVGVVVMPAHPCGEQRVYACRLSSEVEQRTYTPRVVGSNPAVGTNRMRSAASKSRQLTHAGGAHKDVRLFHTQQRAGSNPVTGTTLRRRMAIVRACRRGLMDGHPVSTGIYAGSNPAAGAMDRIQSSRISYVRVA